MLQTAYGMGYSLEVPNMSVGSPHSHSTTVNDKQNLQDMKFMSQALRSLLPNGNDQEFISFEEALIRKGLSPYGRIWHG